MLSVALTGFMIGLLLTPLGLLYGDVQHSLPIASTFLMLLTPVLYPVPAARPRRVGQRPQPADATRHDDARLADDRSPAADLAGFVVVSMVTLHSWCSAGSLYRLALPHLIARLGN